MELRLFRDKPHRVSECQLPAPVYNQARLLVTQSQTGCVFIPIRSLQILAILDPQEFVFVDAQYRSAIAIAWQGFHPQVRQSLEDPVPYQCVLYHPDEEGVLPRLATEFALAVRQYSAKTRTPGEGRVIKFTNRNAAA